jgi:hypothetical protein
MVAADGGARVSVKAEDGFLGVAVVAHCVGAALGYGDCRVA